MADFTPDENKRIDELIATKFENATADDVELYARWKIYQARKHDEFKAIKEYWEKEAQAAQEFYKEAARKSNEIFDLKVKTAREKWENVKAKRENEQQK